MPLDDTAVAEVLARLKAWRLQEAKTQGVPAYVILHDSTLLEIARRVPRDLGTLSGIAGIGQHKLQRYGLALLEHIAA